MKKVGFIDYYLDEYHANHYPEWISSLSGGELEVTYAYAMCDSPSGITTEEWCEKNKIKQIMSIEELVSLSDCINVLSPDNPEMHEQLCSIALKSKKPVYVDKTFAETAEVAKRMFSLAEESGTPCFSASALRFAEEYCVTEKNGIEKIISYGPGELSNYAIHQIEPLVMLMGTEISRIQYVGTKNHSTLIMEWKDGRRAEFSHHGWESPFGMHIDRKGGKSERIEITSDYFKVFIKEMIDFFLTEQVKASHAETIAIVSAIEAALKASESPGVWIAVNTNPT